MNPFLFQFSDLDLSRIYSRSSLAFRTHVCHNQSCGRMARPATTTRPRRTARAKPDVVVRGSKARRASKSPAPRARRRPAPAATVVLDADKPVAKSAAAGTACTACTAAAGGGEADAESSVVVWFVRCAGARLWEFTEAEPARWRPALPWWYKLSSCAYTLLGLQLLLCHQVELASHGAWFPWWLVSCQLVLQGVLSFMADVVSFGTSSRWKVADALGAGSTFFTCATLVPFTWSGDLNFSGAMLRGFSVTMAVAAYCKHRSSIALREGRRDAARTPGSFVLWHTLWHLTLPMGSSAVAAFLL